MNKNMCPCGAPQSSPIPHEHDRTERESQIIEALKQNQFTKKEIMQIKHYIDMNKESFTYYGNKEHFIKREQNIIDKLKILIRTAPDSTIY